MIQEVWILIGSVVLKVSLQPQEAFPFPSPPHLCQHSAPSRGAFFPTRTVPVLSRYVPASPSSLRQPTDATLSEQRTSSNGPLCSVCSARDKRRFHQHDRAVVGGEGVGAAWGCALLVNQEKSGGGAVAMRGPASWTLIVVCVSPWRFFSFCLRVSKYWRCACVCVCV